MHFDKNLLKNGVTGDISIEKERLDNPQGVNYFLWLPVKDHTAPTMKQLWVGVKTIDELVRQKIKIYIHCKNGHGRAPTVLAAYFIFQGMKVEDAITKIQKKRPEIHIEPAQEKMLRRFAESSNH
jgi:protein-tyrosine phosphatase